MIKLKKITDLKTIKKVLFSDCIWNRISEDEQTRKTFEFENKKNYLWLGVYLHNILIGMFFIHPKNNTTIQLHIHIFKKFREKYAFEAGKKMLSLFVNDFPEKYQKMIAEIPVIYKDVYYYSKKFGFKDEGLNRASFKKNGIIHDQFRIGITRAEGKKWVQLQT